MVDENVGYFVGDLAVVKLLKEAGADLNHQRNVMGKLMGRVEVHLSCRCIGVLDVVSNGSRI